MFAYLKMLLDISGGKFDVIEKSLKMPTGGTNWDEYIKRSSNPSNRLLFPSRRNILSIDHTELQELVYVLSLSKNLIDSPSAPADLRYRFRGYSEIVNNKVKNIKPRKVESVSIHAIDPECVKKLKRQANKILKKENSNCLAWRMDMAMLFERYVQCILEKSVKYLTGKMLINPRIPARGPHIKWGPRYLEPDMVALLKKYNLILYADAKYKAHMYFRGSDVSVLKDTFRHDLHPILAYCSFSPQNDKIGYIFYPSETFCHYEISYDAYFSGVNNRIILCGIPFDYKGLEKTSLKLKDLILSNSGI